MTQAPEKKRRTSRKRWWPISTAGILSLHAFVFLALAQCGGEAPGYQNEVSYFNVQKVARSEEPFDLKEPPERMFYQFASMPLTADKEDPLPLSGPRWSGYQALVALKTGDYSPIGNYRLAMNFQKESEPRPLTIYYRTVFRTVVVDGVPAPPVSPVPVPEPGATSLFCLAALGALGIRKRS